MRVVVRPTAPLAPALGHRFDVTLRCEWCGCGWENQRRLPAACESVPSRGTEEE